MKKIFLATGIATTLFITGAVFAGAQYYDNTYYTYNNNCMYSVGYNSDCAYRYGYNYGYNYGYHNNYNYSYYPSHYNSYNTSYVYPYTQTYYTYPTTYYTYPTTYTGYHTSYPQYNNQGYYTYRYVNGRWIPSYDYTYNTNGSCLWINGHYACY